MTLAVVIARQQRTFVCSEANRPTSKRSCPICSAKPFEPVRHTEVLVDRSRAIMALACSKAPAIRGRDVAKDAEGVGLLGPHSELTS